MLADLVEHAVCVVLILLAGIGSYAAGTRRRPARHGSVQIRPPPQRRAATVRRVLQLMPVAARARRARAAQPERARPSRN